MNEDWQGLAEALNNAQKEIARLNRKLTEERRQIKRWKRYLEYKDNYHANRIDEIRKDHDNELYCIGIQLQCRGLILTADNYSRQFKITECEKLPKHPNVNLTIFVSDK